MSEPAEARKSTSVGKLAVLMVTPFMDMVGILTIIPLMPFYAKSMGGVTEDAWRRVRRVESPRQKTP